MHLDSRPFVCLVLTALLLCSCREEPPSALPPLRFEDILYTDRVTPQTLIDNRQGDYLDYGVALYGVLNLPELAYLPDVSVRLSTGLRRFEFVPEMALPPGSPLPPIEERMAEHRETMAAIESFWRPWVNRLYGNEGAWYRIKARAWGIQTTPVSISNSEWLREKYSSEAERLIDQAAAGGDPEGMYLYGIVRFMLSEEKLTLRPEQGWPMLLASAEADWPLAQRAVALAYWQGLYVKKDLDAARQWLEKGVYGGDGESARLLAVMCREEGEDACSAEQVYYYHYLSAGDPVALMEPKSKIDDRRAAELRAMADKRLKDISLAREAEKAARLEKWKGMIPEIKQAIYRDIPWLVWTMAPDSLRDAETEKVLAARGYPRANATAPQVETGNAGAPAGQ